MNTTGRRIIQKFCAIAIIFIMSMADLSLVGANLVSLAINTAETNNQNIEFNAYFLNNNKSLDTTAAIDKKDLKVAFELGVKKDGYLSNSKIELEENANFKFKTDIKSDYISSIDEKSITFKQINEGDTKKVEVGIEYTNLEEFDVDYLSKTSVINLTGNYVNSKNSTQIKGKAELNLNWTYPENINLLLSTEYLTNSTYSEDGVNKKIVQLLVASKIENNSYPVKETNIEVSVPGEPESVVVHKRTTASTNGDKEFTTSNYNYENGKLNIRVQNGQNNKIEWIKNASDVFVVTAKYPETAEIINSKITTKAVVTTYNDKELTQNSEVTITENKENFVSITETEAQAEIAKGKLYAGEQKDYVTKTQIFVDYAQMLQKLAINEQEVKALKEQEEKELAVNYKSIKFNKGNIESVLGNTWSLSIRDQANNVKTITNEEKTDEGGNIIVNFEAGARVLNIETSRPSNNGILKYEVTKTIVKTNYTREQIKELSKIKDSNQVTYTKNDSSTNTAKANSTITLKETESKASIKVEPLTLTTSAEQEMHITAVLETDSESRDLYKNPVVKIKLPKQINKISAKCSLMYGNGLEIKQGNFKINQENGQEVIIINLIGEQKKYEGDAVKGTTLNITANVELSKLATNSTEEVTMTYTNENAVKYADNGEEKVKINIVSENSMILTNNIEEYNVATFGKETDKEIALSNNAETKNATIKMQVVNNEESDISNIAIFGKIANIEGKIERTSKIRTNIENAKVYYTSVDNPTTSISKAENNWKEEASKDSKYYLIVISSLANGAQLNFSYDVNIGKNLPYNLSTETFYNVSYTNNLSNTKKQAESTKIILSTGKIAELKTSLTAKVQGKEIKQGDEVKAGEIVTYIVKMVNSGATDLTNAKLEASIPENTTLIMINPNYPKYDENKGEYLDGEEYFNTILNKNTLVQDNITIKSGQEFSRSFSVVVNENITEEKNIESKFIISQNNEKKEEIIFTSKISPAKLKIICMPYFRKPNTDLLSGCNYIYGLKITNLTNEEQKNIKVLLEKSDAIQFKTIDWSIDGEGGDEESDKDEYEIQLENNNTLTFASIPKNKTILVLINAKVNAIKQNDHLIPSRLSAQVTDSNGKTYRSNELNENIVGALVAIESTSTAENATKGNYVKTGDQIKYVYKIKNEGITDVDKLTITDEFSKYLSLESIKIDGNNATYTLEVIDSDDIEYDTITIEKELKANKEMNIEIIGKVQDDDLPYDKGDLKIINNMTILDEGIKLAEKSEKVYNIEIKIDEDDDLEDDEPEYEQPEDEELEDDELEGDELEDEEQEDEYIDEDDEENTNTNTYSISGIVWKDENNDGLRDDEEELLSGIKVYAINVQTNKIATYNNEEITTTTGSDGRYELANLQEGNYIVAFEYDTDKFMVTSYQTEGVDESINSDAIKASRIVNGEEKTAAFTDSINLEDDKIDIDLGLAEAKIFSLKLDKTINKIIVTNKNGSKTYDYEDKDLAKVEISSKELSGSSVVIEYKLKVTNVGEIAGYAKTIVDYLPKSLTFNSGLNSNWYRKGNNIYTSSLSDTLIEPGQSQEVILTLTKKMTESNTGLTNNKAEIESAYNSMGIPNTTTDKNNNETTDIGSADAIIGVKTGTAANYVALTLTTIIVILGLAYLVNKKLLLDKIEI
ncbi:MAG: hypothetical protein IJK18_02835 [Clostridia bacterium]|nr:hypothetical protein [Clostridia bacterium]